MDDFAAEGRCEFMSQFAEPYAARVIAILLGIPESEWGKIADWGTDLGLSLSIAIREELPRIEAALEGLYGYADELIADRRSGRRTTSSPGSSRPSRTRTGSATRSCACRSCY